MTAEDCVGQAGFRNANQFKTVAWLTGSCLVGAYLLAFRVYDLAGSYALLGEQVRDWGIAQRHFADLPLIGPRSVNSGFDIGPVYYWVLWAGKQVFTPLLGPLPHVGGWVVASAQAIGDAVLVAVLSRTLRSFWLAAAVVVLAGTTTLDASLSAVVWNPPIAEAFAKLTIASVLWPSPPTTGRSILTLVLALCSVQCHATAIFVAAPASAASLFGLLRGRGIVSMGAAASVAGAGTVAWASLYLFRAAEVSPAVPGGSRALSSVTAVLTSPGEHLHPLAGVERVANALDFVYLDPFQGTWPRWLLLASVLLVLLFFFRRAEVVAVSVGPILAAVGAMAIFQGPFGGAYLILPATAVSVGLALSRLPISARRLAALALVLVTVVVQPVRERHILAAYRQPAYGALVKGVTKAAGGEPIRDIQPAFSVPEGMDVLFMYSLAGGALDAHADRAVVIERDGEIRYVDAPPETLFDRGASESRSAASDGTVAD